MIGLWLPVAVYMAAIYWGAGLEQVPAEFNDQRQRGQRPCGDRIEAARFVQRLDPALGHAHVGQAELADRLAHEPRLLAVALDQGHAQPGSGDRKRDAGQAGAGAQVGQGTTSRGDVGHVRVHRERIEQVLVDHLARVAHGGQVVGAVPAHEQREVVEQWRGERLIEAKASQARDEVGMQLRAQGGWERVVHPGDYDVAGAAIGRRHASAPT